MTTTGTDENELVLLLLRLATALALYHGHDVMQDADLHQAALALTRLEIRGRDRSAERTRPRRHLRKADRRGQKVDINSLVG